jgi:hypothetical protein
MAADLVKRAAHAMRTENQVPAVEHASDGDGRLKLLPVAGNRHVAAGRNLPGLQ